MKRKMKEKKTPQHRGKFQKCNTEQRKFFFFFSKPSVLKSFRWALHRMDTRNSPPPKKKKIFREHCTKVNCILFHDVQLCFKEWLPRHLQTFLLKNHFKNIWSLWSFIQNQLIKKSDSDFTQTGVKTKCPAANVLSDRRIDLNQRDVYASFSRRLNI